MILKNQEKPVYLLIAGKAHSGDTAGKQMLQTILEYFGTSLSGSALFVPNYNIEVAQNLTRGVDVWLNTPEYGKEACGTSGMKATANGVLNCTVADGWAAEVEWSKPGWQIDHTRLAESVYELLEQNITPLYYQRNHENVPEGWVQKMRAALSLQPKYSAARMLEEYEKLLYTE